MTTARPSETPLFQSILSFVIFFGTIALVVLLVVFKKKPPADPDEKQPPLVEYTTVKPFNDDIKIRVTGIAQPFREIQMAAEVAGVITKKEDACRAGRYVDGDVPLLSIDSERYKLALDRAKSEVKEAEARQKKAELDLKGAEEILELLADDLQIQSSERDKRKKLHTDNAISDTELIMAERNVIAAQNAKTNQSNRVEALKQELAVQKNSVELKKIRVSEAQIDFDNATIKSPTPGVIISDDAQEDDYVQVGETLLVFEDTSAIEIKCDLRQDQLQSILETRQQTSENDQFRLPPLDASIRYEATGKVYQWNGKLDRYDGLGLDDRTRTTPCRILVKQTRSTEGDRTLVRGMYVSVQLNLKKRPGLLKLPAEAVRAGNVVWLLQNGKLKKQPIQVVNRVSDAKGNESVITEAEPGLIEVGYKLITSPIPQPIDGMELRANSPSESTRQTAVETKSPAPTSPPPKNGQPAPQVGALENSGKGEAA